MPINNITKTKDGYRYRITDDKGIAHDLKSWKNETLTNFRYRCNQLDTELKYSNIITFNELFERWQKEYQFISCGKSDINQSASIYNLFLKDKIGDKDITKITKADCYDILYEAVESNYSQSYLDYIKVTISRPYRWYNHLLEEPIQIPTNNLRIKSKKDVSNKIRVIDHKTEILILEDMDKTNYGNAVRLMLVTGLRPSEAMGLKFSDLTPKGINIQRAITIVGHSKGKTRSANRIIPLTDTIQSIFEEQRRLVDGPWLFPSGGGEPSLNALKLSWKRKIKTHTLYDLRHTFATRMAEQGMPVNLLKYIMGHSNISTTMKYYIHITDEGMEIAKKYME